jgi:hypothetical protein
MPEPLFSRRDAESQRKANLLQLVRRGVFLKGRGFYPPHSCRSHCSCPSLRQRPRERSPIGTFSQATHASHELPDSVRESSSCPFEECPKPLSPAEAQRRGGGQPDLLHTAFPKRSGPLLRNMSLRSTPPERVLTPEGLLVWPYPCPAMARTSPPAHEAISRALGRRGARAA